MEEHQYQLYAKRFKRLATMEALLKMLTLESIYYLLIDWSMREPNLSNSIIRRKAL